MNANGIVGSTLVERFSYQVFLGVDKNRSAKAEPTGIIFKIRVHLRSFAFSFNHRYFHAESL